MLRAEARHPHTQPRVRAQGHAAPSRARARTSRDGKPGPPSRGQPESAPMRGAWSSSDPPLTPLADPRGGNPVRRCLSKLRAVSPQPQKGGGARACSSLCWLGGAEMAPLGSRAHHWRPMTAGQAPGDSLLLLHLAPLATGLQHERAPGFPRALELRRVLGGSGPRDSRALGLEFTNLGPNILPARISHISALRFSHPRNGDNR